MSRCGVAKCRAVAHQQHLARCIRCKAHRIECGLSQTLRPQLTGQLILPEDANG